MTTLTPSKPWYTSKTIWANLAGFVTALGLWAEQDFAVGALGVTLFPAILALLNIVLRLVTRQPVE